LPKTPAPNLHLDQSMRSKDMDESRKGVACLTNPEEQLEHLKIQLRPQTSSTATGDRTIQQTDCQLTLLHLWKEDLSKSDTTEGKMGIWVHGPSHQGARTSLIIQEEPPELG